MFQQTIDPIPMVVEHRLVAIDVLGDNPSYRTFDLLAAQGRFDFSTDLFQIPGHRRIIHLDLLECVVDVFHVGRLYADVGQKVDLPQTIDKGRHLPGMTIASLLPVAPAFVCAFGRFSIVSLSSSNMP